MNRRLLPLVGWSALLSWALVTLGCGGDGTKTTVVPGMHGTSGFETDAEGWTITGDAQASHVAPDYDGHGGNPDGLISAVDDVTGGVWYFQAPAKYLGDASATYGRYLDFDLKTTAISSPFDSFDVLLVGGGMTLGFDATPNPTIDAWTTFHVRLDETAAWRIMTEVSDSAFGDFATLPAPTAAQMKVVLGNLTQLLIRGEFQTGSDTGFLDNVRFGAEQ
jgi:laminin B (domain IV)